MANISNKSLQDWANEHDEDFAIKVKDLIVWRALYSIARIFDLETVDDEGISHGTARDDLPRGSFYVAHALVDSAIAGIIRSKADVCNRLPDIQFKHKMP